MAFLLENLLSSVKAATDARKENKGFLESVGIGLAKGVAGDKPFEVYEQMKKAREKGTSTAGTALAGVLEGVGGGYFDKSKEGQARFQKNLKKAKQVSETALGFHGAVGPEMELVGGKASKKDILGGIKSGIFGGEERKKEVQKKLTEKRKKPNDYRLREEFELLEAPEKPVRTQEKNKIPTHERIDNILEEGDELEDREGTLVRGITYKEPEIKTTIEPKRYGGGLPRGEIIINPLSGRKIRVGGRVYQRLVEKGVLPPMMKSELIIEKYKKYETPSSKGNKDRSIVEYSGNKNKSIVEYGGNKDNKDRSIVEYKGAKEQLDKLKLEIKKLENDKQHSKAIIPKVRLTLDEMMKKLGAGKLLGLSQKKEEELIKRVSSMHNLFEKLIKGNYKGLQVGLKKEILPMIESLKKKITPMIEYSKTPEKKKIYPVREYSPEKKEILTSGPEYVNELIEYKKTKEPKDKQIPNELIEKEPSALRRKLEKQHNQYLPFKNWSEYVKPIHALINRLNVGGGGGGGSSTHISIQPTKSSQKKETKKKANERAESEIQSMLFDKQIYSQSQAKAFLKKNGLKPIKKVHVTKNKLRYRIRPPGKFKKFRIKKIEKGIEAVIGFY